MKFRCLLALLFGVALCCKAQEQTLSLPELVEGVQDWAEENLDTNILAALDNLDDQKAQQFLTNLQQQFQGEYVVNLAALRKPAEAVLPLLQNYEETQPLAAWLKTRMDYLEFADELTFAIPPLSSTNKQPVEPRELNVPISNPTAAKERELWISKVSKRPWPPGSSNQVIQLKPVFIAQNVPAELVWLAEVESSFDARARSPAGAAGLFQLMPATAKRFGLSLWPRDQRLQPKPSAAASAQYLKFLYDKFGDWRLALAAYNAGEGTVQRLLDRYKTRNYDDIATHLPAETQMYVPKVEAVLLRREGAYLEKLSLPQG